MWRACRVRRRLARDVHDRRPEEILQRHEEAGLQRAAEADTQAQGTTHDVTRQLCRSVDMAAISYSQAFNSTQVILICSVI